MQLRRSQSDADDRGLQASTPRSSVRVTDFRMLQSHSPTGYSYYPVDPAGPDKAPWCVYPSASALSAAYVGIGAGHFNEDRPL